MLVHDFLRLSAQRTPDAVAVITPDQRISYADLDRRASQAAQVLIGCGVRRGDRVALALDNGIEVVAAYFGAMKAGAIAVPLPPGAQSDRLGKAIEDCAPRVCVTDRKTLDGQARETILGIPSVFVDGREDIGRRALPEGALNVQAWRAALDSAPGVEPAARTIDLDLAAIIYTSGSTGDPRGAMLSHLNISSNTESIVDYLHLTAADRVMNVLPFYYVYGLSLLHTHVYVGGSVVIDNRFAFPNVVLAAMQEHRVTGFAGVPSTFALLLHRSSLPEMQFPDLRYVTQAGGGMAPALIRRWLEKGPGARFYVMYGATEASARLTYLEPSDLERKLGSIGRGIPNVEMRVLTDEGREAAPGEVGELVARGSNISSGYWNNEPETRAKFGPEGYRTGDLGYADEEGFLFLVGRRQDMIKVGGQRVGAKEIEDVLHEHPSVHEAAVVGGPDALLGEVPVAFIVVRPDTEPQIEDLLAYCRTRLPRHKVPAVVRVQADLPKNGVGKIDKGKLRVEAARTTGPGT